MSNSGVVSPMAMIAACGHKFEGSCALEAYVGDNPSVRGLCWASCVLCSIRFYKDCLTVLVSF